MAQQTAVEYIIEKLQSAQWEYTPWPERRKIIEQAKQMEKEQIVDAHYQGYRNDISTTDISEQYYNETYKQ